MYHPELVFFHENIFLVSTSKNAADGREVEKKQLKELGSDLYVHTVPSKWEKQRTLLFSCGSVLWVFAVGVSDDSSLPCFLGTNSHMILAKSRIVLKLYNRGRQYQWDILVLLQKATKLRLFRSSKQLS